eukprot:scaffold282_cov75-Phaeocystis_antarctica.AAC.3
MKARYWSRPVARGGGANRRRDEACWCASTGAARRVRWCAQKVARLPILSTGAAMARAALRSGNATASSGIHAQWSIRLYPSTRARRQVERKQKAQSPVYTWQGRHISTRARLGGMPCTASLLQMLTGNQRRSSAPRPVSSVVRPVGSRGGVLLLWLQLRLRAAAEAATRRQRQSS